jgi:hypothetical protein
MPTPAQPWTCPTCRIAVATPFCAACGERPIGPPDLTLRGLLAQLAKAVSGIDGRLVRSFRLLVNQPGALTGAYVEGRRKPFIGPFQIFIIANVVFFAVQSLTHTRIFASTLASHLHGQDWSPFAQALVARRLAATSMSLERFAPLFDQAVVLNAKSLVVLMTLPFVLLLPLAYWRSARPFATHAVFTLHVFAFLLLLFCVSLAIAAVNALAGGGGLADARVDDLLTLLNVVASTAYLYLAARAVYARAGIAALGTAVLLALAIVAITLGYRFVIFLITLHTI